jgi:hypothetical protein
MSRGSVRVDGVTDCPTEALGGTAGRDGRELGPGGTLKPQGGGQKPGGVVAGSLVDASLEVADRARAQADLLR